MSSTQSGKNKEREHKELTRCRDPRSGRGREDEDKKSLGVEETVFLSRAKK